MADPFVELGQKLRRVVRSEGRDLATPVSRWRVTGTSPVRLVADNGDVLEEGEEDFEVGALKDAEVGDVVLVGVDGDGDFVGLGVMEAGSGSTAAAALKARVAALEAAQAVLAGRTKQFNVAGGAVVDLGAIDGENITGVRIVVKGVASAANAVMRLRPNGSAANIAVGRHVQRLYWDGATQSTDISGGVSSSVPGFAIGQTDFGVAGSSLWSDVVMHTRTQAGMKRACYGTYGNEDNVANGDRILSGRQFMVWHDVATPITSLSLAMDAGTFTGRVTLEVLP